MILEGKKVNFLGDSITYGSGASKDENKYCAVLTRNEKLAAGRCYGIGGTRFAVQKTPSEIADFDRDFCSRVAEMDPDADLVVVFGGTNDYGHGDAPLGTFADRTPDTFYGACHTLMTSLIEKYIGKPIVFLTPLHREGDTTPKADGSTLSTYVEIIKEVARYYALPVLDLYAMSGIQPNVPVVKEKLTVDGLHPSDAGHAILAERIGNFLRAL